jgi:hypothetical protein
VGAAREPVAEHRRQQAVRAVHHVSSLHRSLIVRSAFNQKNGIGPTISG